jgi:hypothetical protein
MADSEREDRDRRRAAVEREMSRLRSADEPDEADETGERERDDLLDAVDETLQRERERESQDGDERS